MSSKIDLLVPQAVADDPHALEFLRVWVSNGEPHVSLRTRLWDDPAALGVFLAEIAQHLANAEVRAHPETDRKQFLERLMEGLRAELQERGTA